MTQDNLFEWAMRLKEKYGIVEEQLKLPLDEVKEKENETSK
tara:strand:- start:861 stop:983 length:123 start_codon:yes stop_codon:yes gene_type:complete